MTSVENNLLQIRSSFNDDEVTLVAVSKTKPIALLEEAYNAGQRHFGENKVQEMTEKHEVLPQDIHWHMIGHLQRNKVKFIVPYVYLIHGIDSIRLLKSIQKEAKKIDRKVNGLLQIHIAQEDSKFGFSEDELIQALDDGLLDEMSHVEIKGLMGMASNTDDNNQVKNEFLRLKAFFNQLKTAYPQLSAIHTLSMGMSGDYQTAISAGSNMIRVGSAIFGQRNYTSTVQ